MSWLLRNIYLFIVFLTGAAILIVEVAATRILSPWFGNTIFTFSSVISVILGALSVGYYVGGRLADRFPSSRIFFLLIGLSGLSIYLCQLLVVTLLPVLGPRLSIITGPLILSLALFFIPGVIMGMLSPWVIRLQANNNPAEGAATTAGKVFFWSTLGSIAGSLIAGFFLIPHFGLDTIMLTTASLLAAMGVFGLIAAKRSIAAIAALVSLGAIALTASVFAAPRPKPGTRYEANGIYEKIIVRDIDYEGRPTRILQQDRTVSGLMYLDNSDVLPYVKFPLVAQLILPKIQRALAIGGGTYLLPRVVLDNHPEAIIDVAEIEPKLFPLAQKYFRVTPSPQLRNHIADGRRFLHDHPGPYDLIFTDVYHGMTIPSHFTTREYYQLVKRSLSPGGVYMANLVSDLKPDPPSILYSQIRTIREIFPNSEFFAMKGTLHTGTQSIVAFAVNGNAKLPLRSQEVTQNPNPLIKNLPDQQVQFAGIKWELYPVMTDNYAPAEYFAMKSLRRELSSD